MNRQNFPKHLLMAVTIITLAAMAGQIRRWQRDWQPRRSRAVFTPRIPSDGVKSKRETAAEVLVRFRPGTTLERIKDITFRHHDLIDDRIEAVDGLVVIEDEDGLSAEQVVNEYRNLPDVEYAEPN